MSTGRPHLDVLLAQAKAAWEKMTPEQRDAMMREQRDSWTRGQLGMGSDADEAEYRAQMTRR